MLAGALQTAHAVKVSCSATWRLLCCAQTKRVRQCLSVTMRRMLSSRCGPALSRKLGHSLDTANFVRLTTLLPAELCCGFAGATDGHGSSSSDQPDTS
jgi:hypothetical protein